MFTVAIRGIVGVPPELRAVHRKTSVRRNDDKHFVLQARQWAEERVAELAAQGISAKIKPSRRRGEAPCVIYRCDVKLCN